MCETGAGTVGVNKMNSRYFGFRGSVSMMGMLWEHCQAKEKLAHAGNSVPGKTSDKKEKGK